MEILNIGGEWYGGFVLPGSSCENQLGEKREYSEEFSKEAVRTVPEKYEYLGPLLLERRVEIPEDVEGKSLRLFLERVNVASSLAIDGQQIDRQKLGLSTPHIYDLTGRVGPGRHIFSLTLDNSNLASMADMASGYSRDTGGYWNGAIGRIELQWENICHIAGTQIFADCERNVSVRVTIESDTHVPFETQDAMLEVSIPGAATQRFDFKLWTSRQNSTFEFQTAEQLQQWDEFEPTLHEARLRLYVGGMLTDEKTYSFGTRQLKVDNKRLTINGRPMALRGTVDCAIFPLTGYPPMTRETWEHNLGAVKDWGLNHVRFHSWCPPEAAFEVADELGLYLQVEMPLWLNKDVTPLELGDDSIHETYYLKEVRSILKTYGNHPSFCFFSCGNENMGDFELLEDIIRFARAMDDRHLYTMSSNFDHTVSPVEDYFLAARAYGQGIRAQYMQDRVAEATDVNFTEAIKPVPVPVVSFEVGQYCVYPDVDVISKYTGNMLPVNFDVIKKEMQRKGIYNRRRQFVEASGALAARLYKEDVEAVLRTEGMGGFQLLSLTDYTGQNTATVGMLDAFYDDKGVVDRKYWRQFCSARVPLFEARRIYSNREKLVARLGLYDYSSSPLKDPEYTIRLTIGDKTLAEIKQREQEFTYDLGSITEASQITVEVSVEGACNSWRIYVFPENRGEIPQPRIVSIEPAETLSSAFTPLFWSPVFFETDEPCGAIIAADHPALKYFPTDVYPDYQWKQLLENAVAVPESVIDGPIDKIVELVPNFEYNVPGQILFVGDYEGTPALYCGFDLRMEGLEVQQLKHSLYKYTQDRGMKLILL